MGHLPEAIKEAERAVADADKQPHIKAQAQCLLGDLVGFGPRPDYPRAVEYYNRAIRTADALTTNPQSAIRLSAKEVLIDAHLGAAHDIAWGKWNHKETAVPSWLKTASAFAEELVQNDGGTAEHRFRVASRALAACVGTQGKLDPAEWAEQAARVGREMIAAATEGRQKQQAQWEVGLALCDAVQTYQMRGQRDMALQYGQQAAEMLEQGGRGKLKDVPDSYLLGRLYFRLGSIHAIGKRDHAAAVPWFKKAVPVLEQAAERLSLTEQARLGDTLVSMAISYWEIGERQQAVNLTKRGIALIETAANSGAISKSALKVPQSNLAAMESRLNRPDPAERRPERIENAAAKSPILR